MNKRQFFATTFAINIVNVLLFSNVLAGNAGGGGGSGGDYGCMEEGWTLSTCYGSAWRYYDIGTDPTANALDDRNNIIVYGQDDIAPGGIISGCADAGGYYRYAMVAHGENPFTFYSTGDQVGIGSIGWGGTDDEYYVSEFFGGEMAYIGTGDLGEDWWSVKSKFETALNSPNFSSNGYKWSIDSGLGWFCYDKNSDISGTDFTNTAVANFTTGDDVVFAGETTGAEISITTTGAKVDNAKYSIVAYTTNSPNKAGSSSYGSGENVALCDYFTDKTHNNCNILKSESGTLNDKESMSGSTVVKLESYSYRIYDAPAGEYYCIAAAVYPASNNSDSWYISESKCKQIAKKPIFQIWGGGFYSAGNVGASTTSKGHIVGYYDYSPTGDANALFSSWSELAVVSNGVVSNLASGAATSYTYANQNDDNYVGDFALKNCQRARLSFANSICSGGTTGSSGIAADYSIKNTIISRYATEDKYISNTVTIAGKTIPQKTVEVTYASGVSITGDILYEDTAYVSASQVPQYIIYSKGNINIDCNVSRIDAWLIADGTINTCSSAANATVTNGLIDDASGIRSHQLKINGIIIADQLILGRTYGAATGSNSGTPAEIINLSGASYIWAENTASDTPKLYTTYLRELAPRY